MGGIGHGTPLPFGFMFSGKMYPICVPLPVFTVLMYRKDFMFWSISFMNLLLLTPIGCTQARHCKHHCISDSIAHQS